MNMSLASCILSELVVAFKEQHKLICYENRTSRCTRLVLIIPAVIKVASKAPKCWADPLSLPPLKGKQLQVCLWLLAPDANQFRYTGELEDKTMLP